MNKGLINNKGPHRFDKKKLTFFKESFKISAEKKCSGSNCINSKHYLKRLLLYGGQIECIQVSLLFVYSPVSVCFTVF